MMGAYNFNGPAPKTPTKLGGAFAPARGLTPVAPSLADTINGQMQGSMTMLQPFLNDAITNTAPGRNAARLSQKKLAHEAASQPWAPGSSVFSGISDYSGVRRGG